MWIQSLAGVRGQCLDHSAVPLRRAVLVSWYAFREIL